MQKFHYYLTLILYISLTLPAFAQSDRYVYNREVEVAFANGVNAYFGGDYETAIAELDRVIKREVTKSISRILSVIQVIFVDSDRCQVSRLRMMAYGNCRHSPLSGVHAVRPTRLGTTGTFLSGRIVTHSPFTLPSSQPSLALFRDHRVPRDHLVS